MKWQHRPVAFAGVMFLFAVFSIRPDSLCWFWFWMVLGGLGYLVGIIRVILHPEDKE